MTIARKPKNTETQASNFIRGAGKDGAGRNMVPTWANIPRDLLDRVDEQAKKLYMSRTAFIVQALRRELERAE